MKKLAFTIIILVVNLSVAQEIKNNIQNKIFETNIEENHYLVNDIFPNFLKEIKEVKLVEPYNNSEGKFPKYESNKMLENISKKETNANTPTSTNPLVFIDNNLIQKLIETNTIAYNINGGQLFYGDREIIILKNESKTFDKLNVSYKTNAQVEVQIGKNIYGYINKVYKSEIDKTLQNSLNLLVINF